MINSYNLDVSYFTQKLKFVLRDINSYTPEELSRELTRLALTASIEACVHEAAPYQKEI